MLNDNLIINLYLKFLLEIFLYVSTIFKYLVCKKYIERSTNTFWAKKGHLLCSSCLDEIQKTTKKTINKIEGLICIN